MNLIQDILFSFQDNKYASFQAKLIPGIAEEKIIGVRVPQLRLFAKQLVKGAEYEGFIHKLPHHYLEENLLHGMIIADIKDFDTCIQAIEQFLPYIDNWAVCDTISPKVLSRHKQRLLPYIHKWSKSEHVYTSRFALRMLMNHFLDNDFHPDYLQIAVSVRGEDYYLKMMVAWFFATALAKQWEETIPYIEQKRLAPWTHRKAIQKACESYRITSEEKEYLRKLKY